jgi:ribosomal protein S18 acetylase RimI-like enzyme
MSGTGPAAAQMGAGGGEVRIRDARPDEAEAVAAVTLQAYAEFERVMDPAGWAGLDGAVRAALASGAPAERIVAERDGQVLGAVALYPPAFDAYGGYVAHAPWPELRLLAVAPAARGTGIGRMLVEECVRRARRMGAAELGLHTSRSMQVAMGMYERMGFVRAPEYDFQPEGAELVKGYRLPLG